MASVLATIFTSRSSALSEIPGPFLLNPGSEVSIGRSPKCGIVFKDVKAISHVHCYLRNQDSSIQIKDVSSNKTFLDGKVMGKHIWVTIRDGAVISLSHEPKVKLGVKISYDGSAHKKRKSLSVSKPGAIAEIRSEHQPSIQHFVIPSGAHSEEVSVTIGRAKDCDVRIDDKKISSIHCKLIFKRVEGESVNWNLTVDSVSKNKTYLDSYLVEELKTIEPFTEPVKIALVFPLGSKPVDVLTIEPIVAEASPVSDEPILTAAEMIQQELAKEEKRRKRELHQLEKQGKQWEIKYKQDIEDLQSSEHSLMLEIENLERLIKAKKDENRGLLSQVDNMESGMAAAESKFKEEMEVLKKEHEDKLATYTAEVNDVNTRYQRLIEEKIKLQMGLP